MQNNKMSRSCSLGHSPISTRFERRQECVDYFSSCSDHAKSAFSKNNGLPTCYCSMCFKSPSREILLEVRKRSDQTASPELVYMNSPQHKMLLMEYALVEITNACKLSDSELLAKVGVVDALSSAMLQAHSWYHYDQQGIFIIGSVLSGYGMEKCDLDVCLMMSTTEVQRSAALRVLAGVQGLLHQTIRWCNCELIRATVPILNIHDNSTGTTLNLNVNNVVGLRNSHLLRCYANYDWRVTPLVLFVKRWARSHRINSAKNQTICSYALTLMVINYLQCGLGSCPLLPSIQQTQAEFFNEDVPVLIGNVVMPPYIQQSCNTMSLGELLLGFFDLYANNFKFDTTVMSVRLGRHLLLEQVRKAQPTCQDAHSADRQAPLNSYTNAQLFVEEPFNLTNVARSVYDPQTFKKIKAIFQKSYQILKETKDPYRILNNKI
ncbi:poly(A) RNA polymerase gld-2 homolog A-like [Watersipora subatra]|uniref:poly(A) RNA polymerase gld-2 homolog A-like n=1 Tax=Watersipora subatra TaxID=2589382 RepID=UPI00355C401C